MNYDKPTEFVSSLVMTIKPDDTLRVCLDPQYLNTQIQRQQLMIPTLDEITAKLKGNTVFSALDAKKGFYICLSNKNNSKELTTFKTPYGRYYFNRLPFGLCSSPEVFHRVFSNIYKDIEAVEIYIDDILIHAKTKKVHDTILEKVFQRAREYGVKFNRKKCNFRKIQRVKYLGHILTTQGMKVDYGRIKAITDMKEPNNQENLCRFLGIIN